MRKPREDSSGWRHVEEAQRALQNVRQQDVVEDHRGFETGPPREVHAEVHRQHWFQVEEENFAINV